MERSTALNNGREESPADSTTDQLWFSNVTVSLAAILLLFAAVTGGIRVWDEAGFVILQTPRLLCLFAVSLFVISTSWSLLKRRIPVPSLNTFVFGVLLLFFSDWLTRSYNLFQGPSIRGEIVILGIAFLFLVKRSPNYLLPLFLAGSILGLSFAFFSESAGRMIFSDDNPTFIYRMTLLKENFPNIPFYLPLWNGGLDARDFFATGSLNAFFIFSPLLYAFDPTEIYNLMVVLTLFLLLPTSVFGASKISGFSNRSATIAAILSFSFSLLWYRWSLKYGTMGFIVSASLVPINAALSVVLLSPRRELSLREAILLPISFTLMLFWSASGLVFIPFILVGFILSRRLLKKRFFIKIVATLLVLNLPWISLFWSVSKVGNFLSLEKASHKQENVEQNPNMPSAKAINSPAQEHVRQKSSNFNLKKSLKSIRDTFISTNPLLLLFTFPGLFLFYRGDRGFWGLSYLWLLTLGAVLGPMKPQLELDRMLLILTLLLCLPTALCLEKLIEDLERFTPSNFISNSYQRLATVIVFGFLLTGPFCVDNILHRRSIEQFYFESPLVSEMKQAIIKNSGDGRVLFSGFILHDLSDGHLAPMPLWTGKPLMASSPFHNLWQYRQIFPASFISRGDQGIEDFLNLYNVSSVFAHERYWIKYFTDRADKYEQVWSSGKFKMFKRKGILSTYLLSGTASHFNQDLNSVRLNPESEDIVIKFNYLPSLESSSCELAPYQAAPEVIFTKLSHCTVGKEVVIKQKSAWRRLFG